MVTRTVYRLGGGRNALDSRFTRSFYTAEPVENKSPRASTSPASTAPSAI